MRPFFYLDRLDEHLRRTVEADAVYVAASEAERRAEAADQAYNALHDAIDSAHGHATVLARELLELDRIRRRLLARIEGDEEDFDFEELAHPFRPFWTQPLSIVQNVGFLPLRLVEWGLRRSVPRKKDVLETIRGIRERQRQGRADVPSGRAEMERLRGRSRAIERVFGALVGGGAGSPATSGHLARLPAELAPGLARLREAGVRRQGRVQRIEAMLEAIDELPRTSYAEQLYAERVATYGALLETIEGVLGELADARAVAGAIDRARDGLEGAYPAVREWRLSRLVSDVQARRLLDAVRPVVESLSRLSGRAASPNLELPPPRRSLPDLVRLEVRLDRARRVRRARRGPSPGRTARSVARIRELEAARAGSLRQAAEDAPICAGLLPEIRLLIGSMTRRFRSPWRVYSDWIEDTRYHARFTSGFAERLVEATAGALFQRFLALAYASFVAFAGLPSWVDWVVRGRRLDRLRHEEEKILRELAEELVAMSGGVLVPGERMADHLLALEPAPAAEAPAGRATLREAEGSVRSLLEALHRIHAWHLSFERPFLDRSQGRRARAELDRCEASIRAHLRAIRDRLSDHELACRREGRRLALAAAALASGRDPVRRAALERLLDLHEAMTVAGLDASALEPALAAAREGRDGRRVLTFWRAGVDLEGLGALAERATAVLDESVSLGNGPETRFGRQVQKAVVAMGLRRYREADAALDAASPR